MFKLEYRIPKRTRENLERWNLKEFEEEIGDIEGQLKICFDEKSYGGIFDDEFLIWWFRQLSKSCNVLQSGNYVCFYMPETCDLWLEMEVRNQDIYIRRVKYSKDIITCYVVDHPLPEFEYVDWEGTVIKKCDYISEVKNVTRQFIQEIHDLNPELLHSLFFMKLIKIFEP